MRHFSQDACGAAYDAGTRQGRRPGCRGLGLVGSGRWLFACSHYGVEAEGAQGAEEGPGRAAQGDRAQQGSTDSPDHVEFRVGLGF